MLFQEQEKSTEPDVQFHEPDSTTISSASSGVKPASRTERPTLTTSSASSGVKLSSQTTSPHFSLSPDVAFNPRILPETHKAHPKSGNTTRNLPPLPTSAMKDNDMFRFKPVHRSASTRDFRKTVLRNHFGHVYAIDD